MRVYSKNSKLWLCLPAILGGVLDTAVTLMGQPTEYWRDSYSLASEGNPIAIGFITFHPLAFVGYALVELIVVSIFIMLFPTTVSKILSAFYTIGSINQFYNWIFGHLHFGFVLSNLLLFIPTILLVYAFEKSSERKILRYY
jgi:hypothetical protein